MTARAGYPRYDDGGSPVTENMLVDAWRDGEHGRFSAALDIDARVIAMKPNYAFAYIVQAATLAETGRFTEALTSLDQADEFHPNSVRVALWRARIAVLRGNPTLALRLIKEAAKFDTDNQASDDFTLTTQYTIAELFSYASIAEELLGQNDAALADLDQMLKFAWEDSWYTLASHCYVAAVAGLLDMAELTCEQAIKEHAHDIGDYDSLAFTHLRMKRWDVAIQDYNKALYFTPDLTTALYGRGLAKRAAGDTAGANADISAATREEGDIANIMARLGAPTR